MYSKKFIFIDMTEGFRINVFISFFTTFFLILPFVVYNIFSFISPGLYSSLRKNIISNVLYILNFVYLGAFIMLFIIFPVICSFFLGFEQRDARVVFLPRISFYIYFALNLLGSFLVIIFLVILFYFLIDYEYIKVKTVLYLRKYSYVFILLISAFFSPPDLLNQLLLSTILIILYECFVFYSILVNVISNYHEL